MFKYRQIDYFKIVKQLQVPQNIYYIQISPVSQICLPHYLQSMFYTVRVVGIYNAGSTSENTGVTPL